MSKERQYRGKRADNGKWAYGWLYIGANSWILENEPPHQDPDKGLFFFKPIEVVPETVGQSIGRDDKEGKEIYGGDKVKGKWQVDREKVITGVVKYYSNHGLYAIVDEVDGFLLSIVWEGCEIIGNIHEGKP